MEQRSIELIRVHKSNTCISIRDTGVNSENYDLLYFEIGLLNKDKTNLILTNNNKDDFLNGKLFDINSYTLGNTSINDELLEIEQGILQLDYYKLNKLGSFSIVDNTTTINQSILTILNEYDYVFIQNKKYLIDKNRTYNTNLVLINFNLIGLFDLYFGSFDTKYVINDYKLKDNYCLLLKENILSIDKLDDCENTKKISKSDLVTLSLELKAIGILKEVCDINRIASLIESINNKLNNNGKYKCCSN